MPDQAYIAPDEGQLLSRFWQSASGFWKGRSAWRAWLLVVLLIATVLLQLWTQYGLNFWNRDFFNAVERKDAAELWMQTLRFVPLAAASIFLAIFSVWARMTMQRTWREWMSNRLYDYWLENDRYVRLRFVRGDHQAPEFRIAEDVRIATDLPIDLTIGLLSSFLTAITFIGVLWSVGDGLIVSFDGFTLNIPGYLVISVVVYSILLSAATFLIAQHLVHVLEENKRCEAELRSIGTHLRETGEGTALKDDQKDGRQAVGSALKAVIAIWLTYCWQLMRLTLITHASVLITPVIGLLLCTPKYLAGEMSLGEVVQAAAAFVMVTSAFNWFTDNYARLAEWASSANRVASLLLGLDQIDRARADLKGSEE
ncbi:SbmA/BacA-like family transporter [Bradyrhizobium sp. AUGA SZCCT0283]|jgi:putative ATP-binding cassette transporter|uniref:SbmA/BacA-like family transporter n=1 Tax=Bradyrhizobium sp. AUGA SZCCT0283 TaxID=2807671 RepID=UPI001BA83AF1|nr:SbmA/BacA-like family transporter [Bradyrhizobium sp. AUGA SZCCT0283]MBR1275909.1 ABC transporter [Bradyrhizobium sp. AUGA SZCCT0283]